MADRAKFAQTFDALRGILAAHEKELLVTVDKPGDYQVCSRTLKDRVGRPLFVGGVQIKKSYVSYHLMPVYSIPELLAGMSPGLKKRMQGKSCFNFTSIDTEQVSELAALTTIGLKRFQNVKLPWA